MFSLPSRDSKDYFGTSSAVIELKPSDFDSTKNYKLRSKDCGIVLFYAPWCGYCEKTKEMWIKLASKVAFADVAAFNCEKHKGHVMKMNADHPSKAFVKSYPTIVTYRDGNPTSTFAGEITYENLLEAAMQCRSKSS